MPTVTCPSLVLAMDMSQPVGTSHWPHIPTDTLGKDCSHDFTSPTHR
jgi:hypothetical protein